MATYTSKIGVDDLTLLTTLSNDEINGVLSKRYAKDIIYVRLPLASTFSPLALAFNYKKHETK